MLETPLRINHRHWFGEMWANHSFDVIISSNRIPLKRSLCGKHALTSRICIHAEHGTDPERVHLPGIRSEIFSCYTNSIHSRESSAHSWNSATLETDSTRKHVEVDATQTILMPAIIFLFECLAPSRTPASDGLTEERETFESSLQSDVDDAWNLFWYNLLWKIAAIKFIWF